MSDSVSKTNVPHVLHCNQGKKRGMCIGGQVKNNNTERRGIGDIIEWSQYKIISGL